MLAIPVATIRNWEERYAAVVPERSEGGQRLYSPEQVEQLRYVSSQLARGLSAAEAHRLLAEREAGAGPPVDDGPAGGSRPLVLVAERDRFAAERTQALLVGEGFAVEAVFAASDAEERWLGRRARLAIVELMISGGEGTALCRRLKRHDVGPVLAVSALQAREEAKAAGADAFLQKPVEPRALVSTVRDLIAAGARAAGS